jgi:hypothetical protein
VPKEATKRIGRAREKYEYVDASDSIIVLSGLNLDLIMQERVDTHIETTMSSRMMRRVKPLGEEFIHPAVLDVLNHVGLSPTGLRK